jgi:ubiquitin-protein ligase E3 C
MNFSFEGNYKPKRNINLGGVKSHDDKRSLLLKLQNERKAREEERRKLKNTTRIQVDIPYYSFFLFYFFQAK